MRGRNDPGVSPPTIMQFLPMLCPVLADVSQYLALISRGKVICSPQLKHTCNRNTCTNTSSNFRSGSLYVPSAYSLTVVYSTFLSFLFSSTRSYLVPHRYTTQSCKEMGEGARERVGCTVTTPSNQDNSKGCAPLPYYNEANLGLGVQY